MRRALTGLFGPEPDESFVSLLKEGTVNLTDEGCGCQPAPGSAAVRVSLGARQRVGFLPTTGQAAGRSTASEPTAGPTTCTSRPTSASHCCRDHSAATRFAQDVSGAASLGANRNRRYGHISGKKLPIIVNGWQRSADCGWLSRRASCKNRRVDVLAIYRFRRPGQGDRCLAPAVPGRRGRILMRPERPRRRMLESGNHGQGGKRPCPRRYGKPWGRGLETACATSLWTVRCASAPCDPFNGSSAYSPTMVRRQPSTTCSGPSSRERQIGRPCVGRRRSSRFPPRIEYRARSSRE